MRTTGRKTYKVSYQSRLRLLGFLLRTLEGFREDAQKTSGFLTKNDIEKNGYLPSNREGGGGGSPTLMVRPQKKFCLCLLLRAKSV